MSTGDRKDPSALRQEYRQAHLTEADAPTEPLALFRRWFADALAAALAEPNAMVLATVRTDGRPAARTVLLKGFDERGFAFFTNRGSRKADHLAAAPVAALLFPWVDLQRQVEVEGPVEPVADAAADAYFATRPRESQVGAWASRQSSVLSGRAELERRAEEMASRFEGGPVPRPPFWGGYRVVPLRVEFWQGRPGRLHDRLCYERDHPGRPWTRVRLAP